jgi:transcriptional regulator with XRE-family HTH domain
MQPSPLARYVGDRLAERREGPDDFAHRVGINASGLYKLLRGAYTMPTQRNLDKIAAGLGMSAAELLAAVDPIDDDDDLIKQAILQRVPEMREAVEGAPRVFWASIVKSIFDHAVDDARDTARIVSAAARGPVSASPEGGVSGLSAELTRDNDASDGGLAVRQHRPALAAV